MGLWSFGSDWKRAHNMESVLHGTLADMGGVPLAAASDGDRYVGNRGGWRECLRLPAAMLGDAAEQCAFAMLKHDREQVQS